MAKVQPLPVRYQIVPHGVMGMLIFVVTEAMMFAGLVSGDPAPFVIALILMVVLVVLQFCFYFAVRIDYDMRYYIVTDRSVRVREGAFIVKEKTLSYANIQNIKVVQGPLMRFFGISHLQVDTAGGEGGGDEQKKHGDNLHQVRLAGIENAPEVRDLIQGHLRRWGAGAGLGDPDDADRRRAAQVAATTSTALRDALRELKQATGALRETVRG